MSIAELLIAILVISGFFTGIVVYGFVRFNRFRNKDLEAGRRFREIHGDSRPAPEEPADQP